MTFEFWISQMIEAERIFRDGGKVEHADGIAYARKTAQRTIGDEFHKLAVRNDLLERFMDGLSSALESLAADREP